MKTVLYIQTSLNGQNLCELAGVRKFSRSRGWRLLVHPVGMAASEKRAGLIPRRAARIGEIVSELSPDGVIVEGGSLSMRYSLADFGALPTVFLDRCSLAHEDGVACIRSDSERIAEAAFTELERLGYADYAYVPWVSPLEWSVSRGVAFRTLVEQEGARIHLCPPCEPTGANDAFAEFTRHVRRFLLNLPRPVGIFAANDIVGECVLDGLAASGGLVPRDFAVVGVDNDRNVCEHTTPTLSSVMLDFRRAGICAGEALESLMRGEGPRGDLFFGVSEVAHRLSTRKFCRHDPRIAAAVEYVRQHVCENLQVADVVKHMNCSRRLAEMRFRETTGNTILSCIRQERRVVAERLLRDTDCPIGEIARSLGYATADSFRKDFCSQSGLSPRQYRRRAQHY